jgi:hypothetical protein
VELRNCSGTAELQWNCSGTADLLPSMFLELRLELQVALPLEMSGASGGMSGVGEGAASSLIWESVSSEPGVHSISGRVLVGVPVRHFR